MPLLMVARVPITPILLHLVTSAAAFAPGFTTPMIGISSSDFKASSASALAVLQAITIAFTFFSSRNRTICLEYMITVPADLLPYGTLAVSPKYIIFSLGRLAISSFTTVVPPIPESNTPIGADDDMTHTPYILSLSHFKIRIK